MRDIETIKGGDREKLAEKASKKFFGELKRLLQEEGTVVVSLCGGRSVQPFYRKLPEHADKLSQEEWKKVHFFMTDERLVPITSQESNFRLANDLFLKSLGKKKLLLEENVHTFFGGAEEIESEVHKYNEELARISRGAIHMPVMGVGEDGHVGALYPGHDLLDYGEKEYLLLDDSPKPPSNRMTLSPKHVTTSSSPFLFFIGDAKREAYGCFKSGEDPHDCPCRLAKHGEGKAYVVTNLE